MIKPASVAGFGCTSRLPMAMCRTVSPSKPRRLAKHSDRPLPSSVIQISPGPRQMVSRLSSFSNGWLVSTRRSNGLSLTVGLTNVGFSCCVAACGRASASELPPDRKPTMSRSVRREPTFSGLIVGASGSFS